MLLVGMTLALVLAGRLLGFGASWLTPPLLLVPLVLAVAAGAVLARSPDRRDAARRADACFGSDDLLLTACALPAGATGMPALVLARAEARAAAADPRRIIRFQPWPRVAWAVSGLGLAWALTLWLPQLDPFGRVRQEQLRAERAAEAASSRAAAEAKTRALLDQHPEALHAGEVDAALAGLLATLGSREADRTARLRALDAERRNLSLALDRAEERALPATANRDLQRIGSLDPASAAGMRQALVRGEAEAVQRAVAEAAALAREVQGMAPGTRRSAAERELRQRLDDLAKAVAGGGAAAQAVAEALDRLAEAADPALAKAALDALGAELEMADAAAQGLAQGGRDRAALREALETLRQARACAGAGEGEGACGSLAEYREMYQNLLAGQGGEGKGMGPKAGQGSGGTAPENADAATGFTDERSRSPQRAGKIVASWKAPSAQERGAVVEAYRERVQAARREAADAVGGEDLPPAYRAAVKAYFEDLGNGTP